MTSALRTAYTGRHQPLQKATFVSNQANFSFLFSIISLMIIFLYNIHSKIGSYKKKIVKLLPEVLTFYQGSKPLFIKWKEITLQSKCFRPYGLITPWGLVGVVGGTFLATQK